MKVLSLNCGSATIKAKLFDGEREVAAIKAENRDRDVASVLSEFPRPDAVAHRVVHGGSRFTKTTRLDEEVIEEIGKLSELAPLHNPPALEGIERARSLGAPMVAVFDTAFHRTLPEAAWRYAIPRELADAHGVRRYGFHGISHQWAVEEFGGEPTIVTLHLGHGCSAAAVLRGRVVDTSMGFSPLEGLVMGTRGGDLDPAILLWLLKRGFSIERLEEILTRESGLAGLAGASDMRELLARTDEAARLAVEIFCARAAKYAGAYLAALGGAQALVFTGGIGENSPEIRRRICARFEWAGLRLDEGRNAAGAGRISTEDSRLHARVVAADEERLMAREARRVLA
jgi:acetate kinase